MIHSNIIMNRRGVAAVLAVCTLLTILLTSCSEGTPLHAESEPDKFVYQIENTAAQTENLEDGMKLVAVAGVYRLFFNTETTRFAVKAENGTVWYSSLTEEEVEADEFTSGPWARAMTSLVTVYASDVYGELGKEYSCWKDSVQAEMYKVRYIRDTNNQQIGVRVDFTFERISATVPVIVVLTEDGLRVSVPLNEIIYEDPEYIITTINLLPHFASAAVTDEGYLLVPDGSGSIINFNNGKTSSGSFETKIYGNDPVFVSDIDESVMEPSRLPVFGMRRGNSAIMGIIESCDSIANVVAEPSGVNTSRNFVYSNYTLLQTDEYTIKDITGNEQGYTVVDSRRRSWPNIVVQYRFLEGEDADYSGMAAAYGDYLAHTYGLSTQKADTPVMMLDLYGAVKKKEPVFGIPLNVTKTLTTFSQAADMLAELKTGGASQLCVRYKYVTGGKLKKANDESLSMLGKLGGQDGYSDLLTNAENIKFYPAINNVETKGSFLQLKGAYIQNVMEISAYQYKYDILTGTKSDERNRYYLLVPDAVRKLTQSFLASFNKNTYVNSGICLEYLGESLYSSYGKHYYSREDTKKNWQDILQNARKTVDSVMIEGGNAYALPYCDIVADAPMSSNAYAVTNYSVPFLQLAVNKYIVVSGSPINLNSNPRKQLLRCFETGSIPHYAVIAENPSVLQSTELQYLFGVNYSLWNDDILDTYKAYAEFRDAVEETTPTEHIRIMDSVTQTTYENGTRVLVNFSREDVTVEGITVKALDYQILR